MLSHTSAEAIFLRWLLFREVVWEICLSYLRVIFVFANTMLLANWRQTLEDLSWYIFIHRLSRFGVFLSRENSIVKMIPKDDQPDPAGNDARFISGVVEGKIGGFSGHFVNIWIKEMMVHRYRRFSERLNHLESPCGFVTSLYPGGLVRVGPLGVGRCRSLSGATGRCEKWAAVTRCLVSE